MSTGNILRSRFVFAVLIVGMLAPSLIAEMLYVDSQDGSDTNPGNKEKPLLTIGNAADIINGKKEPGPTTIKIGAGVYNLTKAVLFENTRPYTKEERLTIEATILPDDPKWKPVLMPVILSTESNPAWKVCLPKITSGQVKRGFTLSQDPNNGLAIGSKAEKLGNEFEGTVDDVRVYNCALSDAEVAWLARERGHPVLPSSADAIPYALVVNITAKRVPNIYNLVLTRYATKLRALAPVIQVPIRISDV